jgi:hypothetical protein
MNPNQLKFTVYECADLLGTPASVESDKSWIKGRNAVGCASLGGSVYHSYPELSLVYDGQFNESDSLITYTCYHTPWVYIFNRQGDLVGRGGDEGQNPLPNHHPLSGLLRL